MAPWVGWTPCCRTPLKTLENHVLLTSPKPLNPFECGLYACDVFCDVCCRRAGGAALWARADRPLWAVGARLFPTLPLPSPLEDVPHDVRQLAPPRGAGGAVAPAQHRLHRPPPPAHVRPRLPAALCRWVTAGSCMAPAYPRLYVGEWQLVHVRPRLPAALCRWVTAGSRLAPPTRGSMSMNDSWLMYGPAYPRLYVGEWQLAHVWPHLPVALCRWVTADYCMTLMSIGVT